LPGPAKGPFLSPLLDVRLGAQHAGAMQTPISADSVVCFGKFEVDLRSGDLRKSGVKIKLQELPFRALRLLLTRPHEIVTREELRQALWPDGVYVDFDHGISSAINRLRETLGDSAGNAVFIETVERRGYRWVAPAAVIARSASQEADPAARRLREELGEYDQNGGLGHAGRSETPKGAYAARFPAVSTARNEVPLGHGATSAPAPGLEVPGTTSYPRRNHLLAAAMILLIAAVGSTAFYVWRFRHRSAGRVEPAFRAIAVLPLQNAGSSKDVDYLRLSLADEIATSLSRVQAFSIRPSAATNRYSGPLVDLKQAGHDLRVSSIVTGHFLEEGDQIELTLEAVDVANERSIWRDTIRVAAADKIALREQVTTSIRQRLVPLLGESSATAGTGTRPTNEQAYDLYLRSLAAPHDVAPNKDAISMLERATRLDPNYAPAWEALGLRYYYEASFAGGGKAMLQRSDESFARALELDPNLGFSAGALVTNRTERGEMASAYTAAAALVQRWPNSAAAHFALGYVLRYAGLLHEAARECETALSLDPGNFQFRSCSSVFIQLGDPQKGREFVRLDPGSEWAQRQIAFILLDEGKPTEALQSIERTGANPLMDRDLLMTCLDSRKTPRLSAVAPQSEAVALATFDPEPRYFMGAVLAYCGAKEDALRLLRSTVAQKYCSYEALQADPLVAKLRGTPGFDQLLSAANQCQSEFLSARNQTSH
jgi:DNA-binding winged helix-turn-helix (wHTH) protein/TolB-like protein